MVVGASNVWADNTVTVTVGGVSNYYATLKAAIEDNAFKNPTGDIDVSISADQSLGDKVISWEPTANSGYTLTIKATQDITIKGPNGSRWFTVKNAGANLIVGDGDNEITLDGEYSGGTTKQRTAPVALRNNTTASITFNKVTFNNFNLNNAVNMIVGENGDGVITLQDVTINNCVNPKEAYIVNQRCKNDKVLLKGYLNIDEDSKGTTILTTTETTLSGTTYTTTGRIKVDDSAGALTATKTITVTFTEKSTTYVPQIGAPIIINSTNNFTDETAAVFALANDVAYGTFRQNRDLKLTQAYNLSVGEAGAATLVLPFAATIPSGANCYKLTYNDGDDIIATSEASLAANSPVLVIADEGTYKFVSTATSGDAATGSGQTSAYGNMYGNYDASWTVPVQTDSKDNYILQNKASGLGFYKVVEGQNTLSPYRAYLSASFTSGSPARAFLGIRFGGNITDIQSVENGETGFSDDDAPVYNMSGMLMQGGNLPKGIYVKKGKKFIVK